MVDEIKKYIRLQLELFQLSFVEKTSILVGKVVLLGVVGMFVFILAALLLVLIYNLLLSWIGVYWIVTLVMIGIVALLLLVFWIFRFRLIIRPVANMIIKEFYDSSKDKSSEKGGQYE